MRQFSLNKQESSVRMIKSKQADQRDGLVDLKGRSRHLWPDWNHYNIDDKGLFLSLILKWYINIATTISFRFSIDILSILNMHAECVFNGNIDLIYEHFAMQQSTKAATVKKKKCSNQQSRSVLACTIDVGIICNAHLNLTVLTVFWCGPNH